MFSFRRKPKKDLNENPQIRASPSLPELSASGIPWPENLIDRSAIPEPSSPAKGAERTKFHADNGAVPPFHKPWSRGTDSPAGGSISSMYMSHPPSAFDNRKGTGLFKRSRPSQKKARNPTTFNIMVRPRHTSVLLSLHHAPFLIFKSSLNIDLFLTFMIRVSMCVLITCFPFYRW